MWWSSVAFATWTVAAVDPETREVGVAGATCGPFVWMVAELVPDRGAVASQYATSLPGKHTIADALADGAIPDDALQQALDDDEKPELRQYGVVGFEGPAATFTGDEVDEEFGVWEDPTFSVQGNTLRDAELPALAAAAFLAAADEPLAERLLVALEAGRDAGGDSRCDEERPAKSAFLFVAGPDDDAKRPTTELRTSRFGNGDDPVARLREAFDAPPGGCTTAPGSALGGWAAVAALMGVSARGPSSAAARRTGSDRPGGGTRPGWPWRRSTPSGR